MKRGDGPKRRTPMKRGGALRRSKRLETGSGPDTLGAPSPLRRRAASTRSGGMRQIPAAVVDEVRARSRGRCEARTPDCVGGGHHRHHRAGRGRGRDRADLILDVCHACHRYIHDHPAESYEAGWMLHRNAPLDDATGVESET